MISRALWTVLFFAVASMVSAEYWTPRESVRNWQAVASSANGDSLVACVGQRGKVFVSDDSGVTWAPRESVRQWQAITSSAERYLNKLDASVKSRSDHFSKL